MTNSNSGRVTIRDVFEVSTRLEAKIDSCFNELQRQNMTQGERIAGCEAGLVADGRRLNGIDDEIKTLRRQNRIWEGLNSLGIVLAAALGLRK